MSAPSEIAHRIAEQAVEYGARATALSNYLEQVEMFLQHLEGKVETFVTSDDGSLLAFERARGGWRLAYGESDYSRTPVNEGSVELKAAAALLLPLLWSQIESRQANGIKLLDAALEAVESLPFVPKSWAEGEVDE